MPRYDVPMEFDAEDKIIGGKLSLRQVAYIGVAGLIDTGIWFLGFLPAAVRLILMAPITVGALGMAFFEHPEHGRLDKFLWNYYRYIKRPKAYVRGGDSY
ncbi:PrgI family protein [Lentibacillus salinarum]|uniref:PrgI family protein n=1 Tax=Lentibacillus salinarum TaxID=446820 RepID=A0ABW3ZXL9_9BACI